MLKCLKITVLRDVERQMTGSHRNSASVCTAHSGNDAIKKAWLWQGVYSTTHEKACIWRLEMTMLFEQPKDNYKEH